eukprot:6490233-Amphidinium_carterae.2
MSSALFIRGGGTADDVHVSYDLKCWTSESEDQAEWDLHRVAVCLDIGNNKDFTFGVWIRRQWVNLCSTWQGLGLEMRQHFKPARKWETLQSEYTDVPLRDCATVSTRGLLAFLLHCASTHMKARENRRRATALLNSFFARARVSIAQLWSDTVSIQDEEQRQAVFGLCESEGMQPCKHVTDTTRVLERNIGDGERLQSLHSASIACPSVRYCIGIVLRTCAVCVDMMADEEAYSKDVLDGAQLQKPGMKRRHIADDYKRAVVQVRDTGRASSSQQFLRAAQTASEKCAFGWNEKDLLHYQSASWYSAASLNHLTLTFDGGRFGNPATETLVTVASFRSGDLVHGVWLPPQVSCYKTFPHHITLAR